jgi:hypothetical protein
VRSAGYRHLAGPALAQRREDRNGRYVLWKGVEEDLEGLPGPGHVADDQPRRPPGHLADVGTHDLRLLPPKRRELAQFVGVGVLVVVSVPVCERQCDRAECSVAFYSNLMRTMYLTALVVGLPSGALRITKFTKLFANINFEEVT